MGDPKRLLAGSSGLERALLESGAERGPDDAQREALWGNLAATLPGLVGATLLETSRASLAARTGIDALVRTPAKGVSATSLAVGTCVAALGVLVVWAGLARTPKEPAAPIAVPRVHSAPASVGAWERVPSTTPSVESPASTELPVTPAPPSTVQRARPAAPPQTAKVAADGESALLLSARRAVRSGDCDAALARLDEARSRFPEGDLGEERGALHIQALECAGRASEATNERVAFLLLFPNSPYLESVRLR